MLRVSTLGVLVGFIGTVLGTSLSTLNTTSSQQASTNLTYDYIVVGSGAGGGPLASRLALAGHSVLLIEAGDDQGANTNYTIPAFQAAVAEDPKMRWDFYVNHYADLTRAKLDPKFVYNNSDGSQYVGLNPPSDATPLGILYPRAGTLGGCISHNALLWIDAHASDWDNIATITGDPSWYSWNMFQYRQAAQEWINTEQVAPALFQNDSQYAQHIDAGAAVMYSNHPPSPSSPLDGFSNLFQDPNNLGLLRDSTPGYFGVPLITRNGSRYGVRERIVEVQKTTNLTVRTNCHVTKVVFDTSSGTPRATGVQFLDGAYLYYASPLSGGVGVAGSANATKEVILSGGVYNTVQMLKLSGIGPSAELQSHNITPIVDLPGVGLNMQDRYEIAVNVEHIGNFTALDGCTYDAQSHDECYQRWLDHPNASDNGTLRGPYVSNGVAAAMGVVSANASTHSILNPFHDLDLFIFGGALNFTGYFPGWPAAALPDHRHFSWYSLKAHTRNTAGNVTLRSADPLDPPVINFNYFDTGTTEDAADVKDLDTLVQAVKMARQALANYNRYSALGGSSFNETSPGASVNNDEEIAEFIKTRAWGHHASCTNKIGADDDPYAVLNSKFQVRGTDGLRVVDASAFPRIPGIFIQSPIIVMSEKAAHVILYDG